MQGVNNSRIVTVSKQSIKAYIVTGESSKAGKGGGAGGVGRWLPARPSWVQIPISAPSGRVALGQLTAF